VLNDVNKSIIYKSAKKITVKGGFRGLATFQSTVPPTLIPNSSGVHNYNFACCFVWVRNLDSHVEGGT
jgi:hypothetical protein